MTDQEAFDAVVRHVAEHGFSAVRYDLPTYPKWLLDRLEPYFTEPSWTTILEKAAPGVDPGLLQDLQVAYDRADTVESFLEQAKRIAEEHSLSTTSTDPK